MWVKKEKFDEILEISRSNKLNSLEFVEIWNEIRAIKGQISKIATTENIEELKHNVDSLVLWKAQVTELALGTTPKGRDTLKPFGKKIFGARR